MARSYELHHIIHERRQWNSQEPQKKLRESRGMIVPLSPDFHRPVVHKFNPAIPLLPYQIAARALTTYYPHADGGIAIDNMCKAIEEATHNPYVHKIERQLAALTIHALEIQRPYIVAGQLFPSNERGHA